MTRSRVHALRRYGLACGGVLLVIAVSVALRAPSASSAAQTAGYVRAMQRVSATTGWALTSERLARTTDGGSTWIDITPAGVTPSQLIAVRFLDETHGWAIVPGSQSPTPPGATVLLAYRTSDGGATWNSAPVGATSYGGAGPASVVFVDSLHGWLVVQLESSSQFTPGDLFTTLDGGLTWSKARIPVAGHISFTSPTMGWVSGGGPGDQMFRTQDGGASWTRQTVALPAGQTQPVYGVPHQVGSTDVLFTTFASERNAGAGAYVSRDGGATWQLVGSVAAARPIPVAVTVRVAIVDAQNWFAVFPDAQKVYRTTNGGSSFSAVVPAGLPVGVADISFVSANEGWALNQYGGCTAGKTTCTEFGILSQTKDGGTTWTALGP